MASGVHKNTDIKVETVSANSVCRQLPQKTDEQGLAAAGAFAEEVQWALAIRRTISGVGFGEALKLLMNDRDMTLEQMESESGLSVSRLYLCQPDGQAYPPQLSELAFPRFSGSTPDEAHPLPRPAPQLRKPALRQRREPAGNSGVAGAQRYQHHQQYLYPSGFF